MNRYRVRFEITCYADTFGRALARGLELLPDVMRKLRLFPLVVDVGGAGDQLRGLTGPDLGSLVDAGDAWRCEFSVDQVDD